MTPNGGTSAGSGVEAVWGQHAVWSAVAGRLKRRLDLARVMVLLLGVATAVLAAASGTWGGAASRWLGAAAAITAGVATIAQQRLTAERIRSWTAARCLSEGLKSEVYRWLAGGSPYISPEARAELPARARAMIRQAAHLQRYTIGATTNPKPLPQVSDPDSYLRRRVDGQIDYYGTAAGRYLRLQARFRAAGLALGVGAVALSAFAAALSIAELALWVPVLTTVGASVAAHQAAARYEPVIEQYLRARLLLQQRREAFLDSEGRPAPGNAAGFVDDCEAVILGENAGWVAMWKEPPKTGGA